jgi:hypothetical protein
MGQLLWLKLIFGRGSASGGGGGSCECGLRIADCGTGDAHLHRAWAAENVRRLERPVPWLALALAEAAR